MTDYADLPAILSYIQNRFLWLMKHIDALDILNCNPENASLVSGSQSKERMNEYKTHGNWAMRTKLLAEAFGLKD